MRATPLDATIVTLTVLASLSADLLAQRVLRTLPRSSTALLVRAEPLGDLDADGVRDFALVERASAGAPEQLRVISGSTGTTLWSVAGTSFSPIHADDAGDLDGDGRDDVIHGDPDVDLGNGLRGVARIRSGADGSVIRTLQVTAGRSGGSFGADVTGLGDVDGDGTPDFGVGAPWADGFVSGSVWILSGRDGSVVHTRQDAFIGLGTSVANAGDFDGDGTADLVAGDPVGRRCIVVSGLTGALIANLGPGPATFGAAVTGVGDLDGDGRDDIAVGSPGAATYSIYGRRADGTVASLVNTQGEQLGAGLGGLLHGLGDVDGDGMPDLGIGHGELQPGSSSTTALVASNVSTGWSRGPVWLFEVPSTGAPVFLLPAGDVDGDGRADVLAGSLGATSELRVLGAYTLSAVWRRTFADPDRAVGAAVARVADLNGDDRDDLVVGAPEARAGVAGRVLVLDGTNGSLIRTIGAPAPDSEFGAAVAGLPDLDGDGDGDLAVGAPGEDRNGVDSGALHVFSGRDGTHLYSRYGDAAGDRFGATLTTAGDFDADGRGDVAASSSGFRLAGYVRVFGGGATGRQLFERRGGQIDSFFGLGLAGGLDVDADGFDDLLISEPDYLSWLTDGRILVHGGGDGRELRELANIDDWLVASAGDVDDDLHDDFVFLRMGPRIETGAPEPRRFLSQRTDIWDAASGDLDGDGLSDVALVAGSAAAVLRFGLGQGSSFQTLPLARGGSYAGAGIAGLQDVDGDGFEELVVARESDHSIEALRLDATTGSPARAVVFGNGCAGSTGSLPRIEVQRRPFLGQRLRLALRGAQPRSLALLNLGTERNLDLTPLGLTGCDWLAGTEVETFLLTTDANGFATAGLSVPSDPALVGASLAAQWVTSDRVANPFGATLSDGARLVIGAR